MDTYCPELLSKTVFINKNSVSDIMLQRIQDIKEWYADWKKKNPGKKPPAEIINKYKQFLKEVE